MLLGFRACWHVKPAIPDSAHPAAENKLTGQWPERGARQATRLAGDGASACVRGACVCVAPGRQQAVGGRACVKTFWRTMAKGSSTKKRRGKVKRVAERGSRSNCSVQQAHSKPTTSQQLCSALLCSRARHARGGRRLAALFLLPGLCWTGGLAGPPGAELRRTSFHPPSSQSTQTPPSH